MTGWTHIYPHGGACCVSLWLEDGKVLRGMTRDDWSGSMKTVYPYRVSKNGGWDLAEGVSYRTLVNGIEKGNYRMA